jgi:preprotein translocase subunit SecG
VIAFLLKFLLFFLAVFLILLVLIQRGKGGGLAGAFGGLGGQSAFGTKAGDLFTRITIGVAAVWIILCVFSVYYFRIQGELIEQSGRAAPTEQAEGPAEGQPESTPESGAPASPDSGS